MEILELKNVITEIKIHCSDSNSSSRWQKKELVDNPEEGGLESRQLQPDLVSLVHCNPHSRSTSSRSAWNTYQKCCLKQKQETGHQKPWCVSNNMRMFNCPG